MTLEDWSECPSCHFPCSSNGMRAILAAEGTCPMCGERAPPDAIAKLPGPQAQLRAAAAAAGTGGATATQAAGRGSGDRGASTEE